LVKPLSVSVSVAQIHPLLTQVPQALSADPLLVWNYGVMAVLAAVFGTLFWFSVRKLDAQEDALNKLRVGHLVVDRKNVD
jgi:POT family proton-dependent oligopeptide transporter